MGWMGEDVFRELVGMINEPADEMSAGFSASFGLDFVWNKPFPKGGRRRTGFLPDRASQCLGYPMRRSDSRSSCARPSLHRRRSTHRCRGGCSTLGSQSVIVVRTYLCFGHLLRLAQAVSQAQTCSPAVETHRPRKFLLYDCSAIFQEKFSHKPILLN